MQDSRYKPYEEIANVVIRQIEQDEAAATDSRAGDGTEANILITIRMMLAWSALLLM